MIQTNQFLSRLDANETASKLPGLEVLKTVERLIPPDFQEFSNLAIILQGWRHIFCCGGYEFREPPQSAIAAKLQETP